MKHVIQNLIKSVYQAVGNKVYMRDVEKILQKLEALELTAQEEQALEYLARDLVRVKSERNRLKNDNKRHWGF